MFKKYFLFLHVLTSMLLANDIFNEGLALYENREFSKSAVYFEKACDENVKEACNNYAVMLATGQGVKVDITKAATLYIKSCELGSGDGCYNAGAILINLSDTLRNFSDVIKLFENSCELGNSEGCYNLGAIFINGINVGIDMDKSAAYFEKACELSNENSKACLNAGVAQYEKDTKKAKSYFEKACQKNNYLGCYNLGIAKIKLATAKEELESAKFTLKYACQNKEELACLASEDIENALKLLSQ